MKSSLLLLLLLPLFCFGQVSVPNTETFSLQDVYNIVRGHAAFTTNSLQSCFSNSNADYFDPAYNIDTYAPANSMKRFRNYTIPADPPAEVACNAGVSYTGGESYPTVKTVELGTGTGIVTLTFDPINVPDLVIVYYGISRVINTGYYGSLLYDFGYSGRSSFTSALTGKVDPTQPIMLAATYPNTTIYPDDGYPRVSSPGGGVSFTFNKTTSYPTNATVHVYAPMGGTVWNFTLSCPE